jgi:hypothetical protein
LVSKRDTSNSGLRWRLRYHTDCPQPLRWERSIVHAVIAERPSSLPVSEMDCVIEGEPVARALSHLEHALTTQFLNLQQNYMGQVMRFIHIWNELAGRSTSKPEDLPLILANLLGFSTQKVQAIAPEQRLAAIVSSIGGIPYDFLFQKRPPEDRSLIKLHLQMPTQLGRNVLASGPVLKVSKSGSSLELIRNSKLHIYIVNPASSPNTTMLVLEPSGVKDGFDIHDFMRASRDLKGNGSLESCHGVCLAMRSPGPDPMAPATAHVFRISDKFKEEDGRQIWKLSLQASITLRRDPHQGGTLYGIGGAHRVQLALDTVDENPAIFIEHGKSN